jgi:hypothetical protein
MGGASAVFDENSSARRKMALLLYLLVTPPFCIVTYALTPAGQGRFLPALLILALCLTAAVWIAVRRELSPFEWVYPASVAPIASCGIASAWCDMGGLGFMVAAGAPVAWAAVLFDIPAVYAAVASATLVTFVHELLHAGWGAAVSNSVIVLLIQGLVAWVA